MKTIDQTFDETIGLVKFQIEKKILLNELNHLKHFTHLQNDLITQNLFFTVSNNKLQIIATNLDSWLTSIIPIKNLSIEKTAIFTIDAKTLIKIIKTIKEIRQYSDMEIIVTDTPIPNNHLFAVRGEFCDFYETSKYVMAYLKPNYKTLNLKTDLPYLARLSKNFDEFCEYWQMELDKLRRLADDTFYKFKDDCSVLINEMNKADKKHFYNYHTN